MGDSRESGARAVVLFDIDGTLLRRSGPHHRRALEEAVRRLTGWRVSTDHVPVQGMLDGRILEWMLRDAGASTRLIRRLMPDLIRVAQRLYIAAPPPSLHSAVCPGVRPLLYRLRRRGIPAGLVTGNFSRIGWKKIERAGLRHHFQFGVFAEQAPDRATLARLAIRHACRRGWVRPHTRLWLIGDHENDIRAAQSNRIRSLAVATGLSPAADLAACGPDLLLEDLRALDFNLLISA